MPLLILLMLTLLLVAKNPTDSTYQPISRTQVIMGTFGTLSLDKTQEQHISKGFHLLQQIESTLSSYQPHSALSQLNQYRTIPSHPMLRDILLKSQIYHHQTQGYFDISIGSITKKLYHFGEEENIPTKDALDKALLGLEHLQLNKTHITLKNNITLDLGGIGKGYAVDRLSQYYTKQGIIRGEIALSDDIRCLHPCSLQIQNPFKESKAIALLEAKIPHLSISTSGTYRRYIKEPRHHHLINPKTKAQGQHFVSVTVVAQANNTFCDAMATAISVMPYKVALAFVSSQDRFGYLLITSEGKEISGNLEKFVTRY